MRMSTGSRRAVVPKDHLLCARGSEGAATATERLGRFENEENRKHIERERFNQRQAKNQRETDRGERRGIARDTFAGSGYRFTLAQGTEARAKRHRKPGEYRYPAGAAATVGRAAALREHRDGAEKQRNRQY